MWALTTDEFWRAVGEFFLLARERRRLKPSHVQGLGGPHYDTVADIERGDIGNLDRLESYATALDLQLVDVFRAVLKTDVQPLSPEERQIVRKYETTTLEGRRALVALAAALPIETPLAPAESTDAQSERTDDMPSRAIAPRAPKPRSP